MLSQEQEHKMVNAVFTALSEKITDKIEKIKTFWGYLIKTTAFPSQKLTTRNFQT